VQLYVHFPALKNDNYTDTPDSMSKDDPNVPNCDCGDKGIHRVPPGISKFR
jgi:hypothetical protein